MKLLKVKTTKKDADEATLERYRWFKDKESQMNKYGRRIQVYFDSSIYKNGGVTAEINWSAIGSVGTKDAREFANNILKACDELDKATKEAEKKYPELWGK